MKKIICNRTDDIMKWSFTFILLTNFILKNSCGNHVIDDIFKFRRYDETPIVNWKNSEDFKKEGYDVKKILNDVNEDAFLTTPELIKKYGYPIEIHKVITCDGYILELHRIPSNKTNRIPVLLVHGLLDSSYGYISLGPGNSLAYVLSDLGYDIWLANVRGNRYSRKHVYYNPEHRIFWNFSWHEIGIYDLPAIIDYIIRKTGHEKMHYIGHSQGTTTFFVMASEKPSYNSKIISMHAFAPVTYMTHIKSPFLRNLVNILEELDKITSYFGILEFFPNQEFSSIIAQAFCLNEHVSKKICSQILFGLYGYNEPQLNSTLLPVFLGHAPAGASQKQIVHYAQMVKTNRFQKFDHGIFTNYKFYESFYPPEYNLTKITSPIGLYYGGNDYLCSSIDVKKLIKKLKNVFDDYEIKEFNHIDFIFAIDVKKLLYDRVIDNMKKMESKIS